MEASNYKHKKNKTEDPLIIVTAVTAGSSCGVVTTKTANTDWKKMFKLKMC